MWDSQEEQRIRLGKAFFFPDPQPDLPGQTMLVATDLDTTCADAADGQLDVGGYPRVILGLVVTDNEPGTYTLLGGGGDPSREFGSSLMRVSSEHDFGDNLPVGEGELEILSAGEQSWVVEVDLSLVRGVERVPAGRVVGRIVATTCATDF